MTEYRDWSVTAAANTGTAVDGWFAEGMAYSSLNNAAREFQAILARDRKDKNGTLIASGSTSSYVLSPSANIALYRDGDSFVFQANVKNGGATTLQVGTLSARPVVKTDLSALQDGDIVAGGTYEVFYKSASGNFQIVNPSSNVTQGYLTSALSGYANRYELADFPPPLNVSGVTPTIGAGRVTAGQYVATSWSSVAISQSAYFVPFFVNRPIYVQELRIYTPVGETGGSAELAIYDDNGASSTPGTRLLHVPSFTITTNSNYAGGTATASLAPGMYWAAYSLTFSAVAGTIYTLNQDDARPLVCDPTTSIPATALKVATASLEATATAATAMHYGKIVEVYIEYS